MCRRFCFSCATASLRRTGSAHSYRHIGTGADAGAGASAGASAGAGAGAVGGANDSTKTQALVLRKCLANKGYTVYDLES